VRRITFTLLAGAMVLLAATSSARAVDITGNSLLVFCEDSPGSAPYALCIGYPAASPI
jgi:hypothetical protein